MRGGGGKRPFGTFPKIHPFWSSEASLSLNQSQTEINQSKKNCRLVALHRLTSNTRKKEERERAGGDDPDILVLALIGILVLVFFLYFYIDLDWWLIGIEWWR